ncbi:hypothetical protein [Halorussus litoreus]|uniref:hypothetical protein n=1 Tax=Halorussus litoreus TaxID=1710536 RepID=UPI001E5539F2|nr:hypothetical protein [Halorussus litoreus]
MTEFVVPPALEPGDRVAIVAPGSNRATDYPHVYELGLQRLREILIGMGERGLLERFAGVLVGRAKARSPFEDLGSEARAEYRERQRETVVEVVGEYNPDAPVVLDVDFGHTAPVVPVPVGGRVEIDPERERIVLGD